LGIFIFIVSLFVIMNLGKFISNKVKWSGLGDVDKTFGLIFGIFKGGLICVCVFTLVNWFYPHQKWTIATKDTISFQRIYEISEILVKKFPNREDYYKTKEKIKEI
ncbi:MAG: CvpA family protein, partial [Pelagibacteraceae bacterium]|nr:CvpA family protein [Pelagibacteraceae bacterium]